MKNILLVGLINDDDKSLHSLIEKHISEDLQTAGYRVKILAEQDDKLDHDQRRKIIQEAIREDTIGAILSIALMKKEKASVPGKEMKTGNTGWQDGASFWNYQRARSEKIFQPANNVTSTRYYWEAALFNVEDNRLMYIASTRSFDPPNTEDLSHNYGKLIIAHMKSRGILK